MAEAYRVYGCLESRRAVALASVLLAKGLPVARIPETPALTLALATRAGTDQGPYLRTPDGFVLGDLHSILEYLEDVHPEPPLLPERPVRRICARLLEDWIEFWLPLWPRRDWQTIRRLGAHLAASPRLMGRIATRPDWLLAAWVEAELRVRPEADARLASLAPALLGFAVALLESEAEPIAAAPDDALPVSLLPILEEIGRDYARYLVANQSALKDGEDRVVLDLGLGKWAFPARRTCELRRAAIAEELSGMAREERTDVRRMLEPVGAWPVLTLPRILEPFDPTDPRSL